jgi:hypothetical protein
VSAIIAGWVWQQTVGDQLAKYVLIKLADNANDDGIAWPSIKNICAHTEMPERTVKKKLAYLVTEGWITIIKQRAKSGQWDRNVYQIECGDRGHLVPSVVADRGHTVHPDRGHPVHTETSEDLEPSVKSSSGGGLAPAQAVVGAYIEIYRSASGSDPPAKVKGQTAREIKTLLDEGAMPGDVAMACSLMVERRLHPATLASLMLEVQAGPKRTRQAHAKKFGYGMTTADIMDAAQRLKEAKHGTARSNGTGGVVQRGLPRPGA